MKMLETAGRFAGNTFVFWILLFALLGYFFPKNFIGITPYIPVLLGVIMFGMGLTLTFKDFQAIFKSPKSVITGVLAQFTIMPSLAWILAYAFRLPPEVAAGVILVGCCPGGTASNVITYLARGNTALSVTVTSCSTLLAPLLTPLLTFLLASKWLSVSASGMFISIAQIVLIPIIMGIIVNTLLKRRVKKYAQAMPLISVAGIVIVIAAIAAGNTENIAASGLLVFLIVVLHNALGLLLGFIAGKLLKLPFPDQKAISIEVGMQNSGLGAALATAHFSPIAALPSAIFSIWHNISGPLLATWWSRTEKGDDIAPH